MADPPQARDPAMVGLWLMTLVRMIGFAVILGGLWAVGTAGAPSPRLFAGLLLVAGGLALFLFGPKRLLKAWKGGA